MPEVLHSLLPSEEKTTVSEISRLFTKQTDTPSLATGNVQAVVTDSFKKLEGIVLLCIQRPSATLSDCSSVLPGFYMHSVGGFAPSDNGLIDKRPTPAEC